MGLVSWIKNLFVKDEGSQTKSGILPVKNGEPVNSNVLNRPSYIIGGRLDLLNKELEALFNNIVSRKIIIECFARNWSGYTYLENNEIKFAAGKIGVPPNTAMTVKLIDQPDETYNGSGYPAGSGIVIGIKDNSSVSGGILIRTKHQAQYQSILDKMPYSGDLAIKFKAGTSLNVSFVEEDYFFKYLEITYIPGTTSIEDLANAINNAGHPISTYIDSTLIQIGDNNPGTKLVSSLDGVIISPSNIYADLKSFIARFNNLTANKYVVCTYKYVKSLEFDIPYNELKNFWNNNNIYDENGKERGMPRGSVLAIRLPYDSQYLNGTYYGHELKKASITTRGRISLTANDLVILIDGDFDIQKPRPTFNSNGLYIPIAKASNPSTTTINRHSKQSEHMIDDLSYVDFADGIRVGSGQIYCELCKDEVGVSDNGIGSDVYGFTVQKSSLPSAVNVWSEIKKESGESIAPFNNTYSASNVLLGLYNITSGDYHDVYKEGRSFLIRRDLIEGKTYIKFIDSNILQLYKDSPAEDQLWWRESRVIQNPGDGTYYPCHPMPLPFDATTDGDSSIFNNGDGWMITGELHGAVRRLGYAMVQHLKNTNKFKHIDESIDKNMIKSGSIDSSKISQDNNNWSFKGDTTFSYGNVKIDAHGNFQYGYIKDSDIHSYLNSLWRSSGRSGDFGLGLSYAGARYGRVIKRFSFTPFPGYESYLYDIVPILVELPFSPGGSLDFGMACYLYEDELKLYPISDDSNAYKFCGIYIKNNSSSSTGYSSTSSILCVSGICLIRVSDDTINRGNYLTFDYGNNRGLMKKFDSENYIIGFALSPVVVNLYEKFVVAYIFNAPRRVQA
ncbi:MAG: hypothetical protein ABIM30_00105 [candidate division WOR-3 bacterium]